MASADDSRVMSQVSEALKSRTMLFALRCCALIKQLPRDEPGLTVRRQLAKSSTGLAFNYRSSCRARSHVEFTARVGVVAEEADETLGWLEFIEAAKLIPGGAPIDPLVEEARQLLAIFSASVGTARYNERNPPD
jgi:four helix bundle protein